MTTRNLLMALTITLLLALTADRIFGNNAAATEPALLLPPIVAAAQFDLEPAASVVAVSALDAAKDEIGAQRRERLALDLAQQRHEALSDVVVAPPVD